MAKIAVIGAGISGLTCAQQLSKHHSVDVFDKSRGVSGRMATRYAGPYEFDHGAQSFSIKSPEFEAFLKPHMASGTISEWPQPGRYICNPRMNSLGKAMAAQLNVTTGTRIMGLFKFGESWTLVDTNGQAHEGYDHVVCAVPLPQAAELLPKEFSGSAALSQAKMLPAFTVMIGQQQAWPYNWHHKRIASGPIAEININSARPGRECETSIVIQADNGWAKERITQDKDLVLVDLLNAFEDLTGHSVHDAPHQAIHRWLYANVGIAAGQDFLLDDALALSACGDWCIKGNVEAAFLSGYRLSNAIKEQMREYGHSQAIA